MCVTCREVCTTFNVVRKTLDQYSHGVYSIRLKYTIDASKRLSRYSVSECVYQVSIGESQKKPQIRNHKFFGFQGKHGSFLQSGLIGLP